MNGHSSPRLGDARQRSTSQNPGGIARRRRATEYRMPSIRWEVIVNRFNQLAPVALAVSMAFVDAAQAGSLLDSSMYGAIGGTQNVTLNGVTFTSAPGNFIVKNLNGFSGLGVTGGPTGDEIDVG